MDLYDAVPWQNIVGKSGPVAGYRDGPVSAWPAQAFQQMASRLALNITVLANEAWDTFDSETGNAGVEPVATAIANRFQARKWSVAYSNASNLPGLAAALKGKGIHWTDAQFFPEPGCYLWAAAPGIQPGTLPAWCPVSPIAVQDRWEGGFDISTVYTPHLWQPPAPVPVPPPPPPPVPQEVPIAVQLLQVQEGNQGAPVKALQILLNGQAPYALQVDGIFGPKTQAAVRGFQNMEHLAVDGIAGVHTWGALLGVPQ